MVLNTSQQFANNTRRTMLIFLMACLFGGQAQPDDIYHCRNPKNVDKKTQLKCDKNTFEWRLDDLDPDWPPEICGDDYEEEGQPQSMPAPGEIEDDLEPCLLWSIFYGTLNTKSPTLSPTALESANPSGPTEQPTTEDGEDGGVFNPISSLPPASAPVVPVTAAPVFPTDPPTAAPSASPTVFDPTRLTIEAFTLTYTWPPSMELNIFNGPDRLELYDITLQHLETSLRAELNGVPIDKIELSMQTALSSSRLTTAAQAGRSWTELVTGFVQFAIPAPIDSSTLQTLVMDTFSVNALDVYEFRLQLANDEVLREIAKVSMGQDGGEASTDDGDLAGEGASTGSDGGLTWSPLLIAIVACVVVGVCMACCFAYFLLYGRRRSRHSRQAKAQEEHKARDFPELQTDPTPPSDGDAGGLEEYRQHEYEPTPRYPSKLPTPDGITMDADQNLHQPYLLNPVQSDAGSSLRNDGDTYYDMENQSLGPSIAPSVTPSLYSYRDETSMAPGGHDSGLLNAQKQQQAPPPSTSWDNIPKKSSPSKSTTASDKGSPSKKSTSSASTGGLLGGLVGKYMGNKNKNQSALGGDDNSSSEDEYGFEKEANPSVDDANLLRVDTATSNQSVAGNSTSPSYMDDRSLISDGRVGQILGDVHSIQGQESPQNFDDIWNDDDSLGEGHSATKSTITDPDGTEQDVGDVLNISTGSKPFDEADKKDRPFDEERIEQRDIVIPEIPTRNMALVENQQETERWSNNSNSQRGNPILPPLDDDEVSQLGEDDLLPDPVTPHSEAPSTKNTVSPEKIEDESVEDYDNHHKIPDDSTQGSSMVMMEEGSIAEDSYGFVPQKHYQKQNKPVSNPSSLNKNNDDDVKLALPQNLQQGRHVVDSVPGNEVVLSSSGSGDDASVEAVSIGSSSGSGTSSSKKAGLRQLVKGMSVRKKKNSDWAHITNPSPSKDPVPRPISPTPSVGSTDSAMFRALMSEPDVFDTPVATPDEAAAKEAVEDTKRNTPAPLLQRMPSDSDEDDCYLEDDQPVIPYPAGVLPRTAYEEKKDDSSVVFSLDDISTDA